MCTPCAPPCVSMHRPCVSLNFHPGMPPCDLPCVPHAFPPCAHPFLCVILRVLPMSSSASSRVPHRVSPCTFHVSPQFPSWHATVRSSVRPAVRLSVRPSVFPVMCPTVRPSVCPSVRPVCVLLRVLLVSSNVSIRVPTVFLHAPPMDGGGVVYHINPSSDGRFLLTTPPRAFSIV